MMHGQKNIKFMSCVRLYCH